MMYQCSHCWSYMLSVNTNAFIANTTKKSFASAIRSDIDVVINWLVLLASFFFRTITPSATFQLSGMVPFLHITLRSFHSRRKSFGHLLYTLYIIPLGPRADRDLAQLTTSKTSFQVGSLKSKGVAGCSTCNAFNHSPNGSFLSYRGLTCSSVSSFLVLSTPGFSSSNAAFVNIYGSWTKDALFNCWCSTFPPWPLCIL